MSQIYKPGSGGGGDGIIETISGDSGSITGANVTIFANRAVKNSGSTVGFDNSGTISTFNVTDAENNTMIGSLAGNVAMTGILNTVVGASAGRDLTLGAANSLFGVFAGREITEGLQNTAMGVTALGNILTGNNNTCFGYNAGVNYTGAESDNIILGTQEGTVGESGVIRIGTTGEQTSAFFAGIAGVSVSNQEFVVIDSVTGELGSTASPISTKDSFSAYLSASTGNVTGDGTTYGPVIFDTVLSNSLGSYNAATGVFTAAKTAIYSFDSTIAFLGGTAASTDFITIWSGSAFGARAFQLTPVVVGGVVILSATITIPMTLGDTMSVSVNVSGAGAPDVAVFGSVPTGLAVTSLFSCSEQ